MHIGKNEINPNMKPKDLLEKCNNLEPSKFLPHSELEKSIDEVKTEEKITQKDKYHESRTR